MLNLLAEAILGPLGTAIGERVKALHQFNQPAAQFSINTTTLVDWPGMSFDIKSGEKWIFDIKLYSVSLNAASDLRGSIVADGTGEWSFTNPENAVSKTQAIGAASTSVAVATGTGANTDRLSIDGIITATTDTTVQLQLRNNAGTITQTFSEHSHISARRVG